MNRRQPYVRGFSLIELIVTLTIASVLLTVAVPSLVTFQRNSELASRANSLVAATNTARGEAMKRGSFASVVPLDGANWSSGWNVFVDVDRNGVYDSAVDIPLFSAEALPSYLTVTGNGNAAGTTPYISFDASGYSKTIGGAFGNLTLEIKRNDVSGTEELRQTRRVKVANTGRVRVCTPKTTTDSTCTLTASNF